MSDYTPTTDEIRARATTAAARYGFLQELDFERQFDRWLATHDREVAARTLRELYAELSMWDGYNTRDIGWAFLANSVLEHIDEKIERTDR